MTGPRARYRTGSWVSISAPRRWLLIDLEPQHPSVQRLWEVMSSGDGAEDVLDILIGSGVRATPSFMLLWLEGAARGFLRGPGILEVRTAGSVSVHTAEGHLLIAEVAVDPDASEFVLCGADTGAGLELPMASGVTMAARVVVTTAAVADRAAKASPAPVAPTQPSMPESQPQPQPQPQSQSQPKAAAAGEPAEDAKSAAELGEPAAEPGVPATKPGEPASIENVPTVVAADGPAAQSGPSYDYLFGATARPVPIGEALAEQAAESVSDGPGPGFGATAGWHTAAPPGRSVDSRAADSSAAEPSAAEVGPAIAQSERPTPAATKSAEQPAGPERSGLIDGVPWLAAPSATGRSASPKPPAPAPASAFGPASPQLRHATSSVAMPAEKNGEEPADTERTVNRAALLAAAAQAGSGPMVLAGRCPAGHLTPPHSAACRVCRASIPAQQPFEIARPPLGVLRLSTGDTVTLDRGVLIGRKPTAPVDAAERPHLVRVNSPEHDVSRQHAEIVLEGWHVYVRDLGSTNGTMVTLPGQSSQRLREGELQLLEHGTVIVLADEIQCVFEVTS